MVVQSGVAALQRYDDYTRQQAGAGCCNVRGEVVNEEDAEDESNSAGEIVDTLPKSMHMKARVMTA